MDQGLRASITASFRAHKEGQTKFTRRMAITMADFFGFTPKDMVLVLEDMALLKRGSWKWFQENGGITKEDIEKVRGDIAKGETP